MLKAQEEAPQTDTKLTWYEQQLYSYLHLQIEGLPSHGDSDEVETTRPTEMAHSIDLNGATDFDDAECITIDVSKNEDFDQEMWMPNALISHTPTVLAIKRQEESTNVQEESQADHGNPSSSKLFSITPQKQHTVSTPQPQISKRWNLSKREESNGIC